MIRRTVAIAAWLGTGGAFVFGCWWLFLNTSEADLLRLLLSASSLVAGLVGAGIVVNTALLVAAGGRFPSSIRGAARRLHWFLIGAAIVGGAIWLTRSADEVIATRYGEISAWLIATMDWTDASPLFSVTRYVSIWLRWVLVPVAAAAAVAALVRDRGHRVALRSIANAWHWKTLLVATTAFVVLIAWPWQAAFWTSQPLGPAWTEPVIAAMRLLLIAAAASLGAAVIVTAASRAVDRPK